MNTRTTLKDWSEGFLKGEVSKDEMSTFMAAFRSGIEGLRSDYKSKIEPTIYFNPDTKKLAEKGMAFSGIFDEFEKGITDMEKALEGDDRGLFEKSYQAIIASSDRLNSLKSEVAEIMNTISPT
jgi:hypothetical protein